MVVLVHHVKRDLIDENLTHGAVKRGHMFLNLTNVLFYYAKNFISIFSEIS